MKSSEIRTKFFDYFTKQGHHKVASSSLIPAQDPTLLFANAGMNQFKDLFLGLEKRSYTRAVTIQKCMRAGGKHNDLDNVGFTKRHLTFFEMMGNFSFGDYFKKEAIQFAWNFLTKEIGLDEKKLHATVFTTDDDAYDLWATFIGLPETRIHRLGAEDNFWQMGDTGPCGPCTEIYVDRGAQFGCSNCAPGCDCDRFMEVWNLVFMQFNRQPDGTDKPLTQTGVDTGMGLERLCAIVQNKDSVFETDLFTPIIEKIEALTGVDYSMQNDQFKAAFHVLADHIRATSLLIADGCAPSNDGRGYVLRKIIRRAALFAQKLTTKNIFPELAPIVIEHFGEIYPDLVTNKKLIIKILTSEITKFATNLERGQVILSRFMKANKQDKLITGQQTFKLYDTFGFPLELTILIAQEQGYVVDKKGFEKEMEHQKAQSGKKASTVTDHVQLPHDLTTEFTGYTELETTSEVTALISDNKLVTHVPQGSQAWVITKKSPYFIVGGGQVPDKGWIKINGTTTPLLEVKYFNKAIGVKIKTPAALAVGDSITSLVNEPLRVNAMKNHTGTHLLQAALIELFGKQIKQSGSLVHPDYLRFDFTYHENLSTEDIQRVENLVNEKIRANIAVNIEYTTLKDATNRGVIAFFGDKYNPEQVRIVDVPGFSAELCGGTHVERTGDIGAFKIVEVTALSAGHRRIVAVTGPGAMALFQESFNTVKTLSQEFKVKREEVLETVSKQREQINALEKELKKTKKDLISTQLPAWYNAVETVNNVPFLFVTVDNAEHDQLRTIAQSLQGKQPGFYFVISSQGNKSMFLATVSKEYTSRVNLKEFGSLLKDTHGLRGGGSPTSLQGGGGKFGADLESSIKLWLTKL